MRGPILTSLALVLWSAVSLCMASESEISEILKVLNELTAPEETKPMKPIPPATELNKKGIRPPKACGRNAVDIRTDSSGTIDFPPGNSYYPANAKCAWKILGGRGKMISINFTSIDLENNRRCNDYLQLSTMSETSPNNYKYTPLTDKICPARLRDMNQTYFTTNDDGIYVEFKSDGTVNKRGFKFNYQITDDNNPSATPGSGGSSGISNLTCNFDRNNMCGWQNAQGNTINWQTLQVGSGYYAYLDTLSPRNRVGTLTSHQLSAGPSGGRCLTFYYHMALTDGIFKVILNYSGGGSQTVLQRDGSQGNGWLKGTVTLVSKQPYKIQFQHTRGDMFLEIGLAIDDISVTDSKCYSRLNSCGTNIYGSRKKRDLNSLLKVIKEIKEEKKKEMEENLEENKKEMKVNLEEKKREMEENLEQQLDERILGGQATRKGKFPWIVHVRIFPQGVPGPYHVCGGSIIDEEWILTAAHCFDASGYTYRDPDKVRVHLGEHNIYYDQVEESQFVLIPEKVIIHPDRNPHNQGIYRSQYDIALLKLKYKLTFTDEVNAVCLPDSEIPAGTRCSVAGWGRDETGVFSNHLLELSKIMQRDSICTSIFGKITEDMLCAIAPSGVANVCLGDFGGPLVCKQGGKYELAGVASWANKECDFRQRTPGVYADVYYFITWIKGIID